MADFITTIGLDDRLLNRGLDNATRKAEQAGQRMGQSFEKVKTRVDRLVDLGAKLGAAFTGAGALAVKALERISDRNDAAAATFRDVRSAIDDLYDGLGRDLSLGGGGFIAQAVRQLDTLRNASVNFLADAISGEPGKGAEIDALLRRDEQIKQQTAQIRRLNQFEVEQQARIADIQGNPERAAELRLRLVERQLTERFADLDPDRRARAVDLAREVERARMERDQMREREQAQRERQAGFDAANRISQSVQQAELQGRLEIARIGGDAVGAAQIQAQLNRLSREQAFAGATAEERARVFAIGDAVDRARIRQAELETMGGFQAGTNAVRLAASGLSMANRQQVLTASIADPATKAAQGTEENTRIAAEALREIKNRLASGVQAVAG